MGTSSSKSGSRGGSGGGPTQQPKGEKNGGKDSKTKDSKSSKTKDFFGKCVGIESGRKKRRNSSLSSIAEEIAQDLGSLGGQGAISSTGGPEAGCSKAKGEEGFNVKDASVKVKERLDKETGNRIKESVKNVAEKLSPHSGHENVVDDSATDAKVRETLDRLKQASKKAKEAFFAADSTAASETNAAAAGPALHSSKDSVASSKDDKTPFGTTVKENISAAGANIVAAAVNVIGSVVAHRRDSESSFSSDDADKDVVMKMKSKAKKVVNKMTTKGTSLDSSKESLANGELDTEGGIKEKTEETIHPSKSSSSCEDEGETVHESIKETVASAKEKVGSLIAKQPIIAPNPGVHRHHSSSSSDCDVEKKSAPAAVNDKKNEEQNTIVVAAAVESVEANVGSKGDAGGAGRGNSGGAGGSGGGGGGGGGEGGGGDSGGDCGGGDD
jgi:uncharacterized membrane protein YgcG